MATSRPHLRGLLGAAAGAYAGTWLVNRSLRRVDGSSMRPTLSPGRLILVVPTGVLPPRRGDVVVATDPRTGAATVKRLAGVPGDRVVVGPGVVRVVGGPRWIRPRPEPGAPRRRWDLTGDRHLLLGDNPAASTDSRQLGPLPGGVLDAVMVWPPGPALAARRS